LTKTTVEDTKKYLNNLIEEGIIKESEYGKDYYVVKQK
jgi:hypothetical protein